jgi:glutamate transport system substrate-binding protein
MTLRGIAELTAGLAVVLAACGSGGGSGPNPTPAPVAGAPGGKLTIGIAFDQPGLGLKTGDAYTGFDVDTAIYIAGALGVTRDNITWKEANSDQRQQLLESGGADLIVSTFSITDQRKQVVDFAGPYFVAHQDLLGAPQRHRDHRAGPVGRQEPCARCPAPPPRPTSPATSWATSN